MDGAERGFRSYLELMPNVGFRISSFVTRGCIAKFFVSPAPVR